MARMVAASPAPEFREALLESYAIGEQMNQLILACLDPKVWQAKPSGRGARSVVAIFTHMHNIRLKWLRLSAPHLKLPPALDRSRCTKSRASKALAQSAKLCGKMLAEALGGSGQVKRFHRDGWARPWPAGAAMFAYMIVHDAHHRGQVCMLAHQLGFPLPDKATYEMWSWERLAKQCGFSGPH